VSDINLIKLKFSEVVLVETAYSIDPSNIRVEVVGKQSYYSFSWRVVGIEDGIYVPNRNITEF